MIVVSLDSIVKNILLKRGYGLHYYIDFMIGAKDGLRELSFDEDINTIRYKVLPLNENHAIDIPPDYQDWAKVSVRRGQYLQPLTEDNGLDLVPNYDSNFDIQPYSSGIASDTSTTNQYSGYLAPYWWMVNWNVFGENLGRQFGGIGSYSDTFKVNKSRSEIKINEDLFVTEAVLEYIGNGIDADSATHINAYCQNTIEAYAMWQFKEHNRTYSAGEAEAERQKYIGERLILRARLSDLTVDKLKLIVQKNSMGIKY